MNNLIVIMNNSVSSVSGQNRNNFKFFSGGPEEKEIRVRRAWQLAAAGAAANCDASDRRSIPPSVLRQARRGRASASAGGYPAVPVAVRCSIPWCTRSDSEAGAARALAGRAQEVTFPASRASNNSAGASERSACQPRKRRAKGDAASIGCSIPWCTRSDSGAGGGRQADAAQEVIFPLGQEGVMQPGDNLRGHRFYGFGYETLEKGESMITDERKKEIPDKIHRSPVTGFIKCAESFCPLRKIGKGINMVHIEIGVVVKERGPAIRRGAFPEFHPCNSRTQISVGNMRICKPYKENLCLV